ncbi:MAG: hypothetical protein E7231_17215 [Cellulosilyticum sp.]|nr:hypothetical protein [Cellulosilyticum sp.]
MDKRLMGGSLLLIVMLVMGCSSNREKSQRVAIATSQFETKTIALYTEADHDPILITDKEEVEDILDIVNKVDEYKTVPKDKRLEGMCEKWLVFDTGTTIGIYGDEDYGNVGDTIEIIGSPLYLPQGLCAYINQVIESYEINNR